MAEIEVRGYQGEDRDACRRLWEELTNWHREIYGNPTIGGPEPGLFFDEHLKKAGAEHLLVAVAGGEVVGLIGYLVVEEEELEIEPLIVARSHRGKGIGSKLVETVVKRVEKTGIKFLSVRPVARNVRALEFFRDRGFDKVGRVELFVDYTRGDWKKDLRLFDMEFGY